MFKPTRVKVGLFLLMIVVSFSPLFIFGSGPAVIVPAVQIFWLAGLADLMGIPVAHGGGVDAFRLVPATAIGVILTVAGFCLSLAAQYAVACAVATWFSWLSKPGPAGWLPPPRGD